MCSWFPCVPLGLTQCPENTVRAYDIWPIKMAAEMPMQRERASRFDVGMEVFGWVCSLGSPTQPSGYTRQPCLSPWGPVSSSTDLDLPKRPPTQTHTRIRSGMSPASRPTRLPPCFQILLVPCPPYCHSWGKGLLNHKGPLLKAGGHEKKGMPTLRGGPLLVLLFTCV